MSQEKAAEIIDLNASREAPGAAGTQPAGEFLATARRSAGLSLAAVSDATKVKIEHLEAIEATDAGALPIAAYSVGFVKAYARFLGLDEEALARQFKTDIGADKTLAEITPLQTTDTPQIGEGARMASIFGVIAILVFVFWIVVKITGGAGDEEIARAASSPEQRVRLGDAPLERPAPRLRAQEMSAPAAADVAMETAPAQTTATPVQEEVIDAPAAALPLEDADETALASAAADEAMSPADELAPETEDAPPLAAPLQDTTLNEAEGANTAAEEVILSAPAGLSTQPEQEPVARNLAPVREPVIEEARLVRSIAPKYPNRCARGADDLERVTVRFDVSTTGRAENVRVVDSTNDCFNSSAVSTLRRWRFEPKTVDGAARPDLAKQATLNFRQ